MINKTSTMIHILSICPLFKKNVIAVCLIDNHNSKFTPPSNINKLLKCRYNIHVYIIVHIHVTAK